MTLYIRMLAAAGLLAAAGVAAETRLDETTAERFAALALNCVGKEYPNKIAHVMAGDDDVLSPRKLTPAFYGCFDWHSAVHGHWMLARLSRLFPGTKLSEAALAALGRNLTQDALLAEAAYMAHPERAGFERPYGLAWLLQLVHELDEWADEQAGGDRDQVNAWREYLRPSEAIARQRLREWLPKLHYPIRGGEHFQTAFAFGLIWDYAAHAGDEEILALLRDAADRFYASDRDCPLAYEPSGHDFLSPCVAEADFMRRVMEPPRFAAWLDRFLPRIGEDDWLPVGVVTDRADGKLAHIDGLNISRAWMLEGIARGLPEDDTRREALTKASRQHAEAGLEGVTDEHYAGSHWLASFAVYLETRRGL